MSLSTHLDQLKQKHQELSKFIEDEQRRPGSDDLQITELKKEKLQIKEEIERLANAN